MLQAGRMRDDVRFALIFITVALIGIYTHEIGHSVFGWLQGIPTVPTPAKEYPLLARLDWPQKAWISLGGILATVAFVLATLFWYVRHDVCSADPALAGALLPVEFYTLRFLIFGRGHDALEFQAAQSAVGADPSGHLVDLVFLTLFLVACLTWILKRCHSLRWSSLLRASGLFFLGVALAVVLQVANNAAFDRFFPAPVTVNVPPAATAASR